MPSRGNVFAGVYSGPRVGMRSGIIDRSRSHQRQQYVCNERHAHGIYRPSGAKIEIELPQS
jgi:hypothetical protein